MAYISLIDYKYENNKLIISAKSNFPEETKVEVGISGYVKSTKEENTSDTYGNTLVKNGEIKIELIPLNVPQGIKFSVVIDKQNEEIADFFGENGKNVKIADKNKHSISPSIAVFIGEFKINEDLISKLKKEKSPRLKFVKSDDLSHPSEKILASFINCIKNRNWSKMVKYTQKSQNETSKSLNDRFSSIKSVKGFEIIKRNEKGKNFNIITYKLYIQTAIAHKGVQEKIITANVIKENGVWGVNATSATGGLYN